MKKKLFVTLLTLSMLLSYAAPSGFAEEKNVRSEMIEAAKEHLGTPYKKAGTTPKGFDCSGFVLYIYKQFDISLPRVSADQAKAGQAVEKEDLLPGDIVYFKQTPTSRVSHSGIYIGDNEIISSTSSHGIKIDSLSSKSYWGKRYAGARRVLDAE